LDSTTPPEGSLLLEQRGVGFRSLRESIDTTTAGGRLIFHLFRALPSSSA
jgi:DNA invertase Pin-like site-specific DNA recombinase